MARAEKQRKSDKPSGARRGRPRVAPVYGVPKHTRGLLDWAHVQARMADARVYWICTASREGKPHGTPVDGVWMDDRLYFGGDPGTRRNRNLDANPQVCVHLEHGHEVVILEGVAEPLGMPERELAARLAEASNKKYGYGFKPEDYSRPGTYVLRTRVAFAWSGFPLDATRWEFEDE
jgi:nitroimidazol reductase NimA-like FMN-containing flavoprotein (pyridoxamine 5'-phosphate oxidase superfamily)